MSDDQQQMFFNEEAPQPVKPDQSGRKHAHKPITSYDGPLKALIDDNFLQYAAYVIRDRAFPDLDDGLKPVQRRILYSLHENDDGKFIKVANIVGYCMQYHPHGDASIGDALVTLANKRYLIERQGNFGNIFTGDPAAASRYIECRLTDLARHEIFNKELTRFIPSYDGRRKEPVTLPAKLPLLLMLGAEGIGVGLSTRILPHNFGELIEAQIAILRKEPFEILPDFQQGGVMDASEYEQGNGKVKVRAVIEKKNENTLVVRELPYSVTTDHLITSVEDAVRKNKLKLRSIKDYTAEQIEVEIKMAVGQDPDKTIKALFAFTQCEVSISCRMIVIQDNRPCEMTVDEVLRYNTERLVDILKQELELAKSKLLDELHRKSLIQLFVENRIYKRIEQCETYEAVKQEVFDGVNQFRDQLRRDIVDEDVEMLLGIPIKRISLFDMQKNKDDIAKIVTDLAEVEKNLKSLIKYAIRYLKNILKKYAIEFERRTCIETFENIEIRKLTAKELLIRHDKEKGYVGYKIEGEELMHCSSHDKLLLVWEDGRYKVIPPPEKLFVDQDLIYCAKASRDREFLMIYQDDLVTYMKKFSFGGSILNKEYSCTMPKSRILLFTDTQPEAIYVKYKKVKRQRVNQQVFQTADMPCKGVKARGIQMTVKKIRSISTDRPRNWDDDGPAGVLLDM